MYQEQANKRAVELMATMGDLIPLHLQDAIQSMLAVAWIEGSIAGGKEVREIYDEKLSR